VDNNQVGLRQLGQNVSRVMERIKRGEVLVVTEFGKPIARISPMGEARSLEEGIAVGDVTPAKKDWRDLLTSDLVPQGDGESASETLQRLRQDER